MSLRIGKKLIKPYFLLLALLAVSFVLLACRSEPSTSKDVSLVWEAWNTITDSYVGADTLDSEQVAGDIITAMLEASDKPAYPFLTELDNIRGRPPRDVPKELVDVWKALTLIEEKWPDVHAKLVSDAAVEGMLESLGDSSTLRLTNEAYKRAQERLKGAYQGIGAFVGIRDGKVVLSPMENSPAERAGLMPGDIMLEVDGEPILGKSLQEIVATVRGPTGDAVTLLIERTGEPEPIMEFNVIRDSIDMVSVNRWLLPGAIGYIAISDFLETTSDAFFTALEELQLADMLALILDLRSNPGGSVESARKVVSQLLSEGLFMYEIDRQGERRDWPVEGSGLATNSDQLPMVALVNEFTGSGAEAVAGALQDAQRAKILGTRTLGKGSASVYKELSDGSAIYFPVSHWYTPSGRLIQGTGIEPDIDLPITAEERLIGTDPQLAEAYDYLDKLLPLFR